MDFDVSSATAVLERTPATLAALLRGLGKEWLDADEGPNTWSPYFNIAHLILGERTDWIPRARIILEQGANRAFTPFDMNTHLAERRPITTLLDEFAALRAANVATLRAWNLTDAQLALAGVHPEFGEVTLRQLLATWVTHDLGHIAQISRVMAKQYRDAIGPWRAYLPVVDR